MKKNNKGFTLIELLVVIAIIAILASVILASLKTARSKGTDARIKSQLASMRSQAQLYTGPGSAFAAATCITPVGYLFEVTAGLNGLGSSLAGLPAGATGTRCASSAGQPSTGATWAVAAQLSSGAWCVDSTGTSRDKDATGVPYTTDLTTVILGGTTVCQ